MIGRNFNFLAPNSLLLLRLVLPEYECVSNIPFIDDRILRVATATNDQDE
jgi:hypothetical protein